MNVDPGDRSEVALRRVVEPVQLNGRRRSEKAVNSSTRKLTTVFKHFGDFEMAKLRRSSKYTVPSKFAAGGFWRANRVPRSRRYADMNKETSTRSRLECHSPREAQYWNEDVYLHGEFLQSNQSHITAASVEV